MEESITATDLSSGDPGCLTYEHHFGLREKPFSLSPNPRFFFKHSSHARAFDALIAGIRRREGILALIGEVGTGKTTLCRTVLESLDRTTFASFVPGPILSREDLLKTLLVDFGVVSIDGIKAGCLQGASRTELSYALYEFLTSLQPLHAFAVVMIDEAQNLPTALLEEIRILSDMENGERLLQLLLIGQPELRACLSTPEMRQLTQRLSVRCELDPLAQADVGQYISHRLGIAGNSKLVFDEDAIHLTYAASAGIPRVINLLCDRALFRAASAGATTVSAEYIVGAADDLWIPLADFEGPLLHRPVAAPSSSTPAKQLAPESPADDLDKTPDAASRSRATRQGLPSTYQMRHDAHYVEGLESRRQSAMSEIAAYESATSEPTFCAEDAPTKSWQEGVPGNLNTTSHRKGCASTIATSRHSSPRMKGSNNIIVMPPTPVSRHEEIARRAYEIFLARGSEHDRELEDWLLAEQEVAARTDSDRAQQDSALARSRRRSAI